MGLFDRLFGKKEEHQEVSSVKASELPGYVQEIEEKQRERRFSEAMPVLEEIASMVEGVKDDLGSIDSAETPENTPERIRSIIKTSKPGFIKAMNASLSGLDEVPKMDGLEAYRKRLDDFISSAPKTILGQGRYLHYPFREELENMRNDLRLLYEKKKDLDRLLNADRGSGLAGDAKAFMGLLSRKDSLESEEKSLTKAGNEKEASEEELSNSYGALEGSDSYKAYMNMKNRLNGLVQERGLIENDLFNLTSPIKKAAKVALHSLQENDYSGLSKKELAAYSDDPIESLISMDPEERALFFENLKKTLGHESSGHRGEKLGKALSKMDEALLPETGKRIQDLVSLRKEEKKIMQLMDQSPYLSAKADLERSLDKAKREAAEGRIELEKIRRKIAETEKEASALQKKLEDSLSELTEKKISLDI